MSLRFAFPTLYELVVAADDDRRRAATRVACDIARRRTGLAGDVVDRAVAALEAGRYGDTDERRAVKDLAERLEREAVDVDTPAWHRAKAARAHAFALLAQSKRAAGATYAPYVQLCTERAAHHG